ncbi:hypothetical protein LACWKB8_1648 [Lactobacillus sp. wkB8]|nr:hypothetical protein LACWKB8_1648 [Lactobacillus sp. wkB8]
MNCFAKIIHDRILSLFIVLKNVPIFHTKNNNLMLFLF